MKKLVLLLMMMAAAVPAAAQTSNQARFTKVAITSTASDALTLAGGIISTQSSTGGAIIEVRNTSTSATAFARVRIGNDASQTLGEITVASAASSYGDPSPASGVGIASSGSGGIVLGATNASGTVRFQSGGFSERMRIAADGKIGIGTTSPVAGALTIANGMVAIGAALGAYTPSNIVFAGGGGNPDAGAIWWGDGTGWNLHYGTRVSGNFAKRFSFDDRGQLLISSPAGTRGKLRFADSGLDETGIEMDDVNNDLVLNSNAGLQVTTLATTASAANMYYDVTTDEVLRSTSSARYKRDIRDLRVRPRDVLQLRPVIYRAVNGRAAGRAADREYPGFIAEDVAALFPELVTYDAEGRPDYVQYDRVSAYLLVALRDMERRLRAVERAR